jgi:hypothetical protein
MKTKYFGEERTKNEHESEQKTMASPWTSHA